MKITHKYGHTNSKYNPMNLSDNKLIRVSREQSIKNHIISLKKRDKFKKSLINRKPYEAGYMQSFKEYLRRHSRMVRLIFTNNRIRQRYTMNSPTTLFDSFLDRYGYDYLFAKYFFPYERYLSEMRLDAMNMLSDEAVKVFYGVVDDILRRYHEQGFIERLQPSSINQVIARLLESYTFPAVENTVREHHRVVEEILRRGLGEGKTEREIAREIEGYMLMRGERKSSYIYERIARNETARFMNEAKITVWEAMGVTRYDWIQGPGPCNEILICQQMAEGGPYFLGAGPMPVDDTHVNCLCEIVEHDAPNPIVESVGDIFE